MPINNGLTDKDITSLLVVDTVLFAQTFNGNLFCKKGKNGAWFIKSIGLLNKKISSIQTNQSELFAGTSDGEVYKSNNLGDSWNIVHSKIEDDPILSIAIVDSMIFVGTYSEGIYKSSINNGNWIEANQGLTNKIIWTFATFGNTIFAGSDNGVFKSNDLGEKWSGYSFQEKIYSLTVSDSTLFIGCREGKIYRNEIHKDINVKDEWFMVHTRLLNQEVYSLFANKASIFSIGGWENKIHNIGIFRSIDNGDTWKSVKSCQIGLTYKKFEVIDSFLFVESTLGIYRSNDNGENWKYIDIGLPKNTAIVSFQLNGKSLYVGTRWGGSISESHDNGDTWEEVDTSLSNKNIMSMTTLDSVLYFTSDTNGVSRLTKQSEKWVITQLGLIGKRIRYLYSTNSLLFALGQSDSLYKSSDRGITWESVHLGLPEGCHPTTILKYNSTLFLGTEWKGIFYSTNEGESWHIVDTGSENKYIYTLLVYGTTLYAGTNLGLWKTPVKTLGIADFTKSVKISQLKTYPNPVSNLLTIDRSDLPFSESKPVNYLISSVTGKKIIEFSNQERIFSISLNGIPNGVYSLIANQNTEKIISKIIVIE